MNSLGGQDSGLSRTGLSQVLVPAISGPRVVDFGRPLGRVTAWLYNLPEVASTHENLRVPSVSARFATAPVFWNWCRPAPFLAARNAECAVVWVQPQLLLMCFVTSAHVKLATWPCVHSHLGWDAVLSCPLANARRALHCTSPS